MHEPTLAPAPLRTSPIGTARDTLLLALIAKRTERNLVGRVLVRLPSGRARTFGSGHTLAQISFRTFGAVAACVRRGTLGFAEAYLDGDIEVSDLGAVFRFFIDNRHVLERAGSGLFSGRAFDRLG
ncbi:MAG: hypothetical protein AAGG99_00315, partial [Pseudomonadota bacterium]